MGTLFTIIVLSFVVAVLLAVGYALFEISPLGRHKDHYRNALSGEPPNSAASTNNWSNMSCYWLLQKVKVSLKINQKKNRHSNRKSVWNSRRFRITGPKGELANRRHIRCKSCAVMVFGCFAAHDMDVGFGPTRPRWM